MTATGQPAWRYEPEDTSVGIFGNAWEHDACPVPDGPDEGVEERTMAVVRVDWITVRTWLLLTCEDCAAQHLIWYCSPDPSDEYLNEMEADRIAMERAEQAQADAADDAWQAQFDDDPSPYAGTYSEE